MQNSDFWSRITSLYWSQTKPIVFCMQNSVICIRMTSLYGFQTSSVVLSTHNSVPSIRIKRLYCLQPSPVVLCMKNGDFRTGITRLCGFCMQNSDFWTRITNLYGSQTTHVVLCMYNRVLNIRNTSLYWYQTSSVVFACKTSWLASELLVSMGSSPHVLFFDAKQQLLDQNNKSLWVPDITCRFVHAKQCD